MDISDQCRAGWGYPNFQELNHGYLQQVLTRIGIPQTSKIKSWISLICAEQVWYIPKTEMIYLWNANIIWFIHGIACDNQRYPWYISKHWYIPGISLVYAKTRKLINWYQIPDVSTGAMVKLVVSLKCHHFKWLFLRLWWELTTSSPRQYSAWACFFFFSSTCSLP